MDFTNMEVQHIDSLLSETHVDDPRAVDLKKHRNKLLSVSRLHSDVLLQVFMFHRDNRYSKQYIKFISKPDWLATTQVSNSWRSLVRGYALLWDRPAISLVSPEMTQWMLRC
jgi:hypothetical protein